MRVVKKDTNRIAKVNSLIQHELGLILHEFLSEHKGLTTISKVETSKDMKYSKVWISIFNGEDVAILKFLADNIYEIQGEMNKHFFTKVIPRIAFTLTPPRDTRNILRK